MRVVKRKRKKVLVVDYEDKQSFSDLKKFKESGGIGVVHNSTGHENVPSIYCKTLDLKQSWLDGFSTTSVIELGALLGLKAAREQIVLSNNDFTYKFVYKTGFELKDKFVLIIGSMGRIGSGLKEILEGFGMLVLQYDAKSNPAYTINGLLRNLAKADLIYLCINGEGNKGFFKQEYFKACKKSPVLINLVRKNLVSDEQLALALNHKWISSYYVDDNLGPRFKDCFSVHATRHKGANTVEARKRQKVGVEKLIDQMFESD